MVKPGKTTYLWSTVASPVCWTVLERSCDHHLIANTRLPINNLMKASIHPINVSKSQQGSWATSYFQNKSTMAASVFLKGYLDLRYNGETKKKHISMANCSLILSSFHWTIMSRSSDHHLMVNTRLPIKSMTTTSSHQIINVSKSHQGSQATMYFQKVKSTMDASLFFQDRIS